MSINSSRRDFLVNTAAAAALIAQAKGTAAAESASSKLKVGQIGTGHSHAKGKIQVLRNSADWEVVGVVEPDAELRREAEQTEEYQGVQWLSEAALLNTPGLQAVAVETEVADLLDVAERCIAAGMHIHLDKPPGSDFQRFRRLLSNADRQELTVQMGYMYRYNPGIVLLNELLREGWLGEVFEVNAVMSKEVGAAKRQRWAHSPGGSMFELGCHLIDLLIGVLGRPDQVTPYIRHSGDFDDTLMDNMLAVCQYPRATATIRSSAVEVEGGDRRHLVVCGTKGTLQIQPLDKPVAQLALSEPRGKYQADYQTIQLPKYERYIDDLADLAAIIRGDKQSDFNSAHDLAAQETLLKACEMKL
jgi:predicted dehydrogenase